MREKNERYKDITGQKVGKLTAIKRIRTENRKSIWLFRCDCGTEKEIVAGNVLHGTTKSCGCITRFKDITGQKFGRLTAIKLIGTNEKGHTVWLFGCDCGVQKEISSSEVLKHSTKSCGCLRKDGKEKASLVHGGFGTRVHRIWSGMLSRCRNPVNKDYKNYGGRGIQVCDEWHDFSKFQNWALNNGYSDDLSIDRIDSNGNYCPQNCKFSTITEQARNKRNTIWYDINGIKKSLVEWCEILNIPLEIARARNKHGENPFLNEYNETRVYA
jgi:hypothetical protein